MSPNEPVTDLNEQVARLSQQVSTLDTNVTALRQEVGGLGERVTRESERLDQRITEQGQGLERRIHQVELELAAIKSNYATKADLLAVKSSIIMWVVSAFFLAQLLPTLMKQLGH